MFRSLRPSGKRECAASRVHADHRSVLLVVSSYHALRRRKATILTLALSVSMVLASVCAAQTRTILRHWDKRFGGYQNDVLTCATTTTDGGILLGGTSFNDDYWIVKTDHNGRKQWDARFGASQTDYLQGVLQSTNGGFLLTGFSTSGQEGDKSQPSRGGGDFWVVYSDANGNKIWDRRFGGSDGDVAVTAIELNTGGFLIGGFSQSPANGDKTEPVWTFGEPDIWLVRIDANGNKIADKRIGGSGRDEVVSMWQSPSGHIFLAGRTNSGPSGDKTSPSRGSTDFWFIKLDSSLSPVWEKTFGGDKHDYLTSFTPLSDSGFLLCGDSVSGQTGDKTAPQIGTADIWAVRVDADGNKLWDRTYGGTLGEYGPGALEMPYGGFFLAARSQSGVSGNKTQPNKGGNDFWTLCVDTNGTVLCDRTLGGSETDEFRSFILLSGGCAILCGDTYSGKSGDVTQPSRGDHDYWMIKVGMDSDGDRFTDGEELLANTDPNDGSSYLGFTSFSIASDFLSAEMSWRNGTNVRHYVEYTADDMAGDPTWRTVYTNMAPSSVTNATKVSVPADARLFRLRAEAD